jgi:hypothetical protein
VPQHLAHAGRHHVGHNVGHDVGHGTPDATSSRVTSRAKNGLPPVRRHTSATTPGSGAVPATPAINRATSG